MRLYYTGASPDNLQKAREHAPSHSHGYGWTPQKMTPHDGPYFVDNGAYSDSFDAAVDHYYDEHAFTEGMLEWEEGHKRDNQDSGRQSGLEQFARGGQS